MGLFRGFARGAGVFSGEITKLIAESDCTTARFAELMGVDARTLARLERRSEVPAALVAAARWASLAARVGRWSAERVHHRRAPEHVRRQGQAFRPRAYALRVAQRGALDAGVPEVVVRFTGGTMLVADETGTTDDVRTR